MSRVSIRYLLNFQYIYFQETLNEIFRKIRRSDTSKINKEGLRLWSELLKLMTVGKVETHLLVLLFLEAIHRAHQEANVTSKPSNQSDKLIARTVIDGEHMEKIVAQLLLDF